MWFQRLNKSFKKFLIIYPIFAWFAFWAMIFSRKENNSVDDTAGLAAMFFILYGLWILAYLLIYAFYSLYLFLNKWVYHVQSWNWLFAKYFNFKKKKVWKYPIIIQYEWPKDLSSIEMAYLYNFRQFWSNISSILYKWLYEKRIEIDFHYWKKNSIKSFDILDSHSNKKLYLDERQIRWLFFDWKGKISLPSKLFYKNISKISTLIAHSCYNKWYIEEWLVIDNSMDCKLSLSALWVVLFCILIFCSNFSWHWKLAFFFLAVCIWTLFAFWLLEWGNAPYKVYFTRYRLSEKWKEALALIYWYKYFLEACDEKQIKALLEKDPEYVDKTMQYAAALGVNTEIFKVLIPWFIEWVNTNWFFWDISDSALDVMKTN